MEGFEAPGEIRSIEMIETWIVNSSQVKPRQASVSEIP